MGRNPIIPALGLCDMGLRLSEEALSWSPRQYLIGGGLEFGSRCTPVTTQDQVGRTFGDHDRRGVGIAADQGRHDGSIDYS